VNTNNWAKLLGHLIRKTTLLKNYHALVKKATITEQDMQKSIWRPGASDPQTIWWYKG